MKIELTHKGANALRDFAGAMPVVLENIKAATEKLKQEHQSLAETLGVHRESYLSMLRRVGKAVQDAAEAIEAMPPKLKETADRIDTYVKKAEAEEQADSAIMRGVADRNVRRSVLPKSGGHWADESAVGNTTWLLDDNAQISWKKGGERHVTSGSELKDKYGIEGVAYCGGEPDFSPFEDSVIGHVELGNFSDMRTGMNGTYAQARQAAADALGWESAQIDAYMEEHGLTWHECGDRKTVCAIPTEINAAFKHTGGIGIKRSLEAMGDEWKERYGDRKLSLRRIPCQGTVSRDDLEKVIYATQKKYKDRRRGSKH